MSNPVTVNADERRKLRAASEQLEYMHELMQTIDEMPPPWRGGTVEVEKVTHAERELAKLQAEIREITDRIDTEALAMGDPLEWWQALTPREREYWKQRAAEETGLNKSAAGIAGAHAAYERARAQESPITHEIPDDPGKE